MPVAPYGSWPSPITPDLLVERVVRLGDVVVDGDDVYWVEARPSDAGRQALVRPGLDGQRHDVTPSDFSVHTLVHEYGGRCVAVRAGVVFASNFADQRLWRIDASGAVPITAADRGWRFADPDVSPDGQWVYCVRETHGEGEVRNEIVRVPADGSTEPEVLMSGPDFVAAPRLSPDGRQLAWLSWNHPDMPWDSTELRVDGRLVAGGPGESVSQPRWSPDGELCWISDRSGWWNLPMVAMEAEFSRPDWVFGRSTYTFLDDGRLVAAWHAPGRMRLGVVDRATGAIQEIDQPFTELASLHAHGDAVVGIGASATTAPAIVRISIPDGAVEVLAQSRPVALDPGVLSVPGTIEFPTTEGDTARALYYPPRNGDWTGPTGERPPLLVTSHGGPTSQASSTLDLSIQWWTSRGFAVVDVDYRGSSGYGREYRRRLQGNWGVFDVDDCVHAAAWLAERGDVDPKRVVVRGESASGFTTLCALAFRPGAFAAGATHFGVGDLEALARDTHKFESRYLDRLLGPYPEAADVYRARSPIHSADRITAPVIIFQGLEDKVVPPQQAEALAEALGRNGVPFEYLAFEGEQHGFRKADTVKRVLEAELRFFGRVLGFEPALQPAAEPDATQRPR